MFRGFAAFASESNPLWLPHSFYWNEQESMDKSEENVNV